MPSDGTAPRTPNGPLPREVEVSTPGMCVVVDGAGVLVDRSPRAALDPELGALELGREVPQALVASADARRVVHEGSPLDALWFSRGERALSGGLDERDFGVMLHRLRNLVTVLVASQETEEMVGAGPVSTRLGSTHRRELERLVDVLTGLGHAHGPAFARSFVDLEQVLRRSIDSARGAAKRRGVTLRLEGAREARRGRTGDEAMLQSALDALVANAIDASPEGGEVRLRVEPSAAAVTLVVEDDGAGFAPPTQGAPGAPFATSKRGRIGLGLPVARRAAFLHGGELHVADRARSDGVSASLWLPTARA